ncbi:family 16 glycosylhydrolase [uncultured Dokdonia sp.]|uniref:family 16 glycosylhydrolase n=1 Tax=uncultured Dokdonia sp. TaxID=575653 RepID=UPI0026282773|nr:family 16 glycosylhydrolase [uncultured Dokdonia sp.]
MRIFIVLLFLSVGVSICAQEENYELVWSDEFDGNGAIDATKWHHQTLLPNGNSWYNGEIQHYTNRMENSFVSGGTLKIVAKSETFSDQGVTKSHTSARLNSKYAFTYGYVEIRAKLPTGVGTWPAMWTLGQNITEPGGYWSASNGTTSWPACGEIDIMEHWGDNQNFVQSAMHTPSSFGDTQNKGGQVVPAASSEFHIYTLEWTPEQMIFKVDGVEHYTYDPPVQNPSTWPFDAPQYILLNVAVLPNILDSFDESALEVDYIRVFQDPTLSLEEPTVDASIQLFPNPVTDTLSVRVPAAFLGARASLYLLSGQELHNAEIQNENTTIDVSEYAKGVYILTLEKEGQRVIRKVVKR